MVIGAMWASCELSLLVSQYNHSDLSLKALDDALKWFYQKKGIFWEQKMSKSAKDKVDDLWAMESHQLCEQKISKICAAMKSLVYGAEKIWTTKSGEFQLPLNRARQAATTCSDADGQKVIERFAREIHQVIPTKCKLFDKWFQCHERPLLQEVRTRATSPRSKFAIELAIMKTAAKDKVDRVANMTTDKQPQFQIDLSDVETEATTWCLADTEQVTHQLEREIYGITLNEQKRFKKEFSIHLIEFEAWWETICVQAIQKTIEQCVVHFRYPKIHLRSYISDSIWPIGTGDNVTNNISERLHITTVKEAYWSSNKVYYLRQMLKHNDQCIGLEYMEKTLSYIALQGWYDIDSAKVLNLLSPTNKRQSTQLEAICQVSKWMRRSPSFALHHTRYSIWEKCTSAECAEVSN